MAHVHDVHDGYEERSSAGWIIAVVALVLLALVLFYLWQSGTITQVFVQPAPQEQPAQPAPDINIQPPPNQPAPDNGGGGGAPGVVPPDGGETSPTP